LSQRFVAALCRSALSQRFVAALCRSALSQRFDRKKIEMVFFLLWKADYKWL
jgi:hypothetical protein